MIFLSRLKKLFLTPLGTRMTREELNQSRGVALLVVIMGIAMLTSIVSDLGYNETVRYRLAIHTRDAVKAEALAAGGLNWARLLLVIQGKIQNIITQLAATGVPLPSTTIWELMPIDSEFLKGLTSGDLAASLGVDMKEALQAREEKKKAAGEENKKAFGTPDGGYGNFDGSFDVKVVDEESKISLLGFGTSTDLNQRARTRKLLLSLMAPKRYDDIFDTGQNINTNVDRPSLVANIFDWVDANDLRTDPYITASNWGNIGSGSEKEVYANDKGIVPKNAYFDSLDELRLVHGVNDSFERAFFDAITIYGQGGKINILSAKDQVVEALMRFCAENPEDPLFQDPSFSDDLVKKWREYGVEGQGPVSVPGFLAFLEARGLGINKQACAEIIDVKSKTFTLTARATVNDVTRTLTLVAGVVDNKEVLDYFRSR
jgi:general secretion pathway protein K